MLLNRAVKRIINPSSGLVLSDGPTVSCLCLLAGKIDMVKSKWGLALAAVVTVLSSLLMSVGLCTLFGLTPTLNGG